MMIKTPTRSSRSSRVRKGVRATVRACGRIRRVRAEKVRQLGVSEGDAAGDSWRWWACDHCLLTESPSDGKTSDKTPA
jgi:hypothetical protein